MICQCDRDSNWQLIEGEEMHSILLDLPLSGIRGPKLAFRASTVRGNLATWRYTVRIIREEGAENGCKRDCFGFESFFRLGCA